MSEICSTLPSVEPSPQRLVPARAGVLRGWVLLLIAFVAAGVYANSLYNGFAYDDLAIVKESQNVVNLEWTRIWSANYWPRNEGIQPDALYRPLTIWSYLANQAITPNSPGPFHFVNVILHALVTVLMVLLAMRLMGDRRIAVVAGLLFAVHPLHTEVVANTVGRAELLATLWSLLALLVFLPQKSLAQADLPQARPWWHGLLVSACFFAAILSKETPATLLVAIPLIDAWRWLQWSSRRPKYWRWLGSQTLRYYLPMAATFGVYLAMRVQACGALNNIKNVHRVVNPLVDATVMERVITPFSLLAKYLMLIFWPVELSADYSYPSLMPTTNILKGNSFQPPAALGMMICLLAVIMCVMTWRKRPLLALLMCLFGCSYMLVANVLRIGTIFGERLFYWPSVFVLIMIAWAAVEVYQHLTQKNAAAERQPRRLPWNLSLSAVAAISVVTALVGLMGIRTWVRNPDWADNISLAISTARDNPRSGKACSWAGAVLVRTNGPDAVAVGKSLIERAIELAPEYVSARWEIATFYGIRGKLGESAVYVAEAARRDPGSHLSREAIPAVVSDLRHADPETYMPFIEANLRDHPDDESAHLAMAMAYHAQKRYDEAEASARKALDIAIHIRPDGSDQFHEAGAEMGMIRFESGKVEEGLKTFRTYTGHMQRSVDAYCTLASMLLSLDVKKYPTAMDEANANLVAASAIDPENSRVKELRNELHNTKLALSKATTATASVFPDQHSGPDLKPGVGP